MFKPMQHSPFTVQPYRRRYLESYFNRMSKDNDNVIYDSNVAAVLEGQGYTVEESPRSIYRVDKLYAGLQRFKSGKLWVDEKNLSFKSGVSFAWRVFGNPSTEKLDLLPFSVELINSITKNRSGSAGLTAWGQTKAESMVRAFERGVQTIKGVKRPEPCIAFARTQQNEKTRLVWGYPYSMTAIEGLFARPLISKFLSKRSVMAFGVSTLELGSRLRNSSYHNRYAYSTDYSGYDATIPPSLIKVAFNILATWFDLDQLEPTSGVKYDVIYSLIKDYFLNTPIVMPDGNIYKGKQMGIPSGSYFTQLVGSICNCIILGAASKEFSLNVGMNDLYVLGDDCLYFSNRYVNPEHIAKFINRLFGVQTNLEKTSFTDQPNRIHFLGRDWINGEPTLDEKEILKKMVFPERWRRYSTKPEVRRQQVKMLLASYASVYREGYRAYRKQFGLFAEYLVKNMDLEVDVYENMNAPPGNSFNADDWLTGLSRYTRAYVWEKDRVSTPPIAIQFLK